MSITAPPTTAADRPRGYVFADHPAAGADHHHQLLDHLAEMLDPFTRHRLEQAGIREGGRCLEVGAGTGTIACWMADLVGPDDGEVVATDINPTRIPAHPGVTVLRHDIVQDSLPGKFDLIHVRLVLAHLGDRHAILRRLADALNPGGVLVVEEFDASWERCVLSTPDVNGYRLFTAYHHALLAVLVAAGADPSWGRQVHHEMRQAGLVDVEAEQWSRSWHGGEAGCMLPHTASVQLHDGLVAAGMDPDDLDRFRALLLDPELVVLGNTALSTIGHRAPGEK